MTGLQLIEKLTELGQEALTKEVWLQVNHPSGQAPADGIACDDHTVLIGASS